VQLLRTCHPQDPVFDAAITHALLRRVGAAELGPVARVFRPGPTMAFGRLDALAAGFDGARTAATAHGYTPLVRLGGGHAAGYDEGSLVVELIRPERAIAEGIEARFAGATALLVETLGAVGLVARVGELEGEYCAGAWSVNAAGIKLAGTAQRSIRGASLVTAMVIVEGGARLRAALVDVYAALDIAWRPQTAGAAQDVVPGLRVTDVEQAAIATLANRESLVAGEPDAPTLVLARELRRHHRQGASRAAGS
jgi:octanoyl-[GcvH]:protein N-octanoyltransferase